MSRCRARHVGGAHRALPGVGHGTFRQFLVNRGDCGGNLGQEEDREVEWEG